MPCKQKLSERTPKEILCLFLTAERQFLLSNKEEKTQDYGILQQLGHSYIITRKDSV